MFKNVKKEKEKMKGKLRMAVLLLLVIPGLLFTASCSKKVVKTGDEAAAAGQITGPGGVSMNQDDLARQQAIEEERLRQERLRQEEEERRQGEQGGSGMTSGRAAGEDIYFVYDSAALSGEAQEILRQKAEWLRSNNASVTIEGHCDERGTNEYNMALGDRRAESAKSFLVNLGIPASRMTTVSYGEERPADSGHSESSWSKNRRAHFVTE